MVVWSSWGGVPRARLGLFVPGDSEEVPSPLGGSSRTIDRMVSHAWQARSQSRKDRNRYLSDATRELNEELDLRAAGVRVLPQEHLVILGLEEQQKSYARSVLIGVLGGGYIG